MLPVRHVMPIEVRQIAMQRFFRSLESPSLAILGNQLDTFAFQPVLLRCVP